MANDRLINSTQGESIINGLNTIATKLDALKTITAADNGKVVVNGVLTEQTSTSTTTNGTLNTTTNNSVVVNVPNSYTAQDEGKVVSSGALVEQSTHKSITANGEGIDTTHYSSVDVTVSNSYSAGDEGKVVSGGALVVQTAYPTTVTENDTYDTTNYNSITVNVSGGISDIVATFRFDSTVPATTSLYYLQDTYNIIRAYAFYDCKSLYSITIRNIVTDIQHEVFSNCENLVIVEFEQNSGLETIGSFAFENCSQLQSMIVPNSVTSIGENAFYGCNELETVTFEPTTPPTLAGDLGLPTTCTIRVPQGTLSAYTSASNYPDPSDYTYVEY